MDSALAAPASVPAFDVTLAERSLPMGAVAVRDSIYRTIVDSAPDGAPEFFHGHDAFDEAVFPDPRMPDARSFLFGP